MTKEITIKDYHDKVRSFTAGYNLDLSDHIINVCASIMMTRDKFLQGGSFVSAFVDNNLIEAVNRADDECIKHFRIMSIVMRNCYMDETF